MTPFCHPGRHLTAVLQQLGYWPKLRTVTSSAAVFVTTATSADADRIAQCQRSAWQLRYHNLVPETALPPASALTAAWHDAIVQAETDETAAVLVATLNGEVVGVLAFAASSDPDLPNTISEIADIAVHPEATGHGHGSRLLAAWADITKAAGAAGGSMWVPASDDPLRRLLSEAGFAADRAHQTLDLDGDGSTVVRMLRYRTSFSHD